MPTGVATRICIGNIHPKHIEKLSKYKDLEIETARMWGMWTESVPVVVGALGRIRKGMDQNIYRKDPWSQ